MLTYHQLGERILLKGRRPKSLPTCDFLSEEPVHGLGAVSPDRVDQGLEDVVEIVEQHVRSVEQLAKGPIPAKVITGFDPGEIYLPLILLACQVIYYRRPCRSLLLCTLCV